MMYVMCKSHTSPAAWRSQLTTVGCRRCCDGRSESCKQNRRNGSCTQHILLMSACFYLGDGIAVAPVRTGKILVVKQERCPLLTRRQEAKPSLQHLKHHSECGRPTQLTIRQASTGTTR